MPCCHTELFMHNPSLLVVDETFYFLATETDISADHGDRSKWVSWPKKSTTNKMTA